MSRGWGMDVLARYARVQEALGGGCGDGNCVVRRLAGMHTNGGCKCMHQPDAVRAARAAHALSLMQDMADEIARLRGLAGAEAARAGEDHCFRCGAPRSNHPYRNPFVGVRK